jgi:hypothetical protein
MLTKRKETAVSSYDERVAASDRVAARAEAILAGQLAQQGRLPNNYTEAEYHAAREAAQAELDAEAAPPPVDARAVRSARGAHAAIWRVLDSDLATRGSRSTTSPMPPTTWPATRPQPSGQTPHRRSSERSLDVVAGGEDVRVRLVERLGSDAC